MRQRFHAIFLFLSVSALSVAFWGCSAKNSSDAEYIDEDYSSEYDDFSSSSVDSPDSTSSSSGQKTSSSAESSSSLTSSSSEEYDSPKTSAYIDSIYDSRSSKTYKTVQIGSNVWLAQNLSYKTNKSKCYDDRLENCEVFGRMYKVYSDSVCPTGFSLPTKENWESLIKIAGSTGLLKTSRYWEKSDKGKRGNDSLGLSLVPGGLCREDKCAKLNKYAYYAIKDSASAVYEVSYENDSLVLRSKKDFADSIYVSVRCIKAASSVQTAKELQANCNNGDSTFVIDERTPYKCKYSQWHKVRDTRPDSCNKELATTIYNNTLYTCKSGIWGTYSSLDFEIGFCSEANKGETYDLFGKAYVCNDSLEWRAQSIEEAKGACKNKYATEIVSFDGNKYVCENQQWRRLIYPETTVGLCTEKMAGDTVVQFTGHAASGGGIDIAYFEVKFFVCKDKQWHETTDDNEILGACDSKRNGDVVQKPSVATDKNTWPRYACENGKWRLATTIEKYAGVCTSKIQDSVTMAAGYHVYCDKGSWRMATPEEFYGACTKALQDEYYDDSTKYICDNLVWRKLDPPPTGTTEYCTSKNEGDKFTRKTSVTTLRYYCHNYKWTPVTELEYRIGICEQDSLGKKVSVSPDSSSYECVKLSNGDYWWKQLSIEEEFGIKCDMDYQDTVRLSQVCDDGSWREFSSLEKKIGTCTKTQLGKRAKNSSSYYMCKENGWTSITADLYNLGSCTSENENAVAIANNNEHICQEGQWIVPNKLTSVSSCGYDQLYRYGSYNGHIYQCIKAGYGYTFAGYVYAWKRTGDVALAYGMCDLSREGKVVNVNDSLFYCGNHMWVEASIKQILDASPCSETTIYGQKYKCSNGSWAPVYGTMKDSRDQKSYKTLKIRDAVWMAENLNYQTTNSWCFQNIDQNCDANGRLYTWDNVAKACPTGWHAATIDDYATIILDRLAVSFTDYDSWQDKPYDDENYIPGLEIKGVGTRYPSGTFELDHRFAGVWLNTTYESSADSAAFLGFGDPKNQQITENVGRIKVGIEHTDYKYTAYVSTSVQDKNYGFFIRCVKD